MTLKMQSSCLPIALSKILNSRLENLWDKHTEILEATESIQIRVMMAEEQVNKLALSESSTSDEALTLAVEMDELLETMTKCHKVLSLLNCEPRLLKSAEMMKEMTLEHGQASRTDDSASAINSTVPSIIDNYSSTISMLKVQMEVLQQHVFNLQESHDARLPELETKVKVLEEDRSLMNNKLAVRLQNNIIMRLETEVLSMKDDLNRLNSHQEGLGDRIGEVKRTTDDLVSLRTILNDLHMNVTHREELTHKFNELEEELTTFKCLLSPLLEQVTEDNPGDEDQKAVKPVFVAQVHKILKVQPNQRICCQTVWQESNGYDQDTGIFTAPVAGLYLFSVSMSTCSEGVFCVAIMYNYKKVAGSGTTGKADEQTCTSVFLRLSLGDRVWIEADVQTDLGGIVIGVGYSNFIGCCLK